MLNRIRDMRSGALNDSRWGVRQRGQGAHADQIRALFAAAARKHGLDGSLPALRADAFAGRRSLDSRCDCSETRG